MSKYLEKLKDAEEAIAGEIVDDRIAEFSANEKQAAAILLGRAQATDRISVALSAEVIRFLEHFEKTKLYRALDKPDFVTFLADSGLHGVTKNKYYDRIKLLKKEGDPVFDALTTAGVPLAVRGQLEPGDVAVEGDSIIVRGDDDSDDLVFHKDDHQAIVQALRNQGITRRAVAKELAALKQTTADADAKHDEKVRELYAEIDVEKARQKSEFASDPHMMARLEANLALQKLIDIAASLSDIEKAQFRDAVLEELAAHRNDLAAAYSPSATTRATPDIETDDEDEAWAIDFVQDLPGDNDAELIAKL